MKVEQMIRQSNISNSSFRFVNVFGAVLAPSYKLLADTIYSYPANFAGEMPLPPGRAALTMEVAG